jgi:eukaryotic-like serine/threonine-protein kinase
VRRKVKGNQSSTWDLKTRSCGFRSWKGFEEGLAEHLRSLGRKPERFIVFACRNIYFQAASRKDGSLFAEATSNYYLAGSERLSARSCRRLVRMGWRRPIDDERAKKTKNFWCQWSPPVPVYEVAKMAVATLRDVFEVASPSRITFCRGSFQSPSVPDAPNTPEALESLETLETGTWTNPIGDPALRLRAGSLVGNAFSGQQYRVGRLLGTGGFGAAYEIANADEVSPSGGCVLKVSVEAENWHREAYFGELLRGEPGIIQVYDSFAWLPRRRDRRPLYILITELGEGGDLARYLSEHPGSWPESKARKEISRLARAVRLLHASGAVHRDITPGNIFVTRGRALKLGDFGIASHRVGRREVAADAFALWFAPPTIRHEVTRSWLPADDVYQLGQLFGLLISGTADSPLSVRDVRDLGCSPESKAVIQRCIGERRKRFVDADQLLAALEKQDRSTVRRGNVRSLAGRRVVFTGRLAMPRARAALAVKKVGGIVEGQVSHETDVVVVGEGSPLWKAQRKGQKLLDVDRERELHHHIVVISERRFRQLIGR